MPRPEFEIHTFIIKGGYFSLSKLYVEGLSPNVMVLEDGALGCDQISTYS